MPNRYTLKELYNCDPKVANITLKQMYQKNYSFLCAYNLFSLGYKLYALTIIHRYIFVAILHHFNHVK